MEFRTAKLDNGLTIIAELNPAAASLALGFFTRTGSRDETPEISGVSHFLEHMVFKGTERRDNFQVNLDFDRMGAQYNAFTSEENTVFYGSVLPEFQNDLLDLLGDILRPSLRQADFDTEKGVILEEISMYDDMPHFRIYDNLMADHFHGHPLGNSILGTKQSITDLKRDQMQHYFDRRYSPTNVTLIAVGKIDFDSLVTKANEICGHWKPFDAPRSVTPCYGSRNKKIMTDSRLTRENMGFMSPAPPFMSEERFAADVLAGILGDSTGSRLYYALIETGLADEASCQYSCMDGSGGLLTFLSCDPENAQKVTDIAKEEYRKFMAGGPTEAELAAAKNKFATNATLKGELPMGRLTAVGFDWVYRGEYIPLHDQIQKLLDVTCEDILKLAKECEIDNPTTLALGPVEKLEL